MDAGSRSSVDGALRSAEPGRSPNFRSGLTVIGAVRESCHVRYPPDADPPRGHRNRNQVDSADPEAVGEESHLSSLGRSKGVGRVVEAAGLNRLDLNGYSPTVDSDNQIDLPTPDSHVSRQDLGMVRSEESSSESFALLGELPSTQSRTPGSNSSMLTSRNVNTRTF